MCHGAGKHINLKAYKAATTAAANPGLKLIHRQGISWQGIKAFLLTG
jgi:hypothetical protein